ncbi:hypothetical protein J4481_02125 [Candidatus Pacearchaeota archaeon]|nr:hypothetical protein [Candidatus Pacearchaeota archaeon]
MGKLLIISVVVLLVLVVGFVLFNNSSEENISGKTILNVDENLVNEENNFADFTSEFTCSMMKGFDASETLDDNLGVLAQTESIAEKYDLTLEDIETLEKKYENNIEFQQKVFEGMKKLCPESLEGASLQ